jgi:hypothetical protein
MNRVGGLLAFLCCSSPYMVWKVSSIGSSLQNGGILGSRLRVRLGAELCISHDPVLTIVTALERRHGIFFNQGCQDFQRCQRNQRLFSSLRGGGDMEDKEDEKDEEQDEYEVNSE